MGQKITAWYFNHGEWSEIEVHTPEGDQADLPERMSRTAEYERLGYTLRMSVGDDDMFSLTLVEREAHPRYLLEISDPSRYEWLAVDTLPAALDLLARYAPIVTAAEIAEAASDIRNMSECGILSSAVASLEVNARDADRMARNERERRAEFAAACRARKREREAAKTAEIG
jgi:hypothetical protein